MHPAQPRSEKQLGNRPVLAGLIYSFSPITGPAPPVRHSNNLDSIVNLTENQQKRKPLEKVAARSMQIERANLRRIADPLGRPHRVLP
jgi:hypothetical protein